MDERQKAQSLDTSDSPATDREPTLKPKKRTDLFYTKHDISVTLHVADIVEADADAVVTSEDRTMSNPSQVTKALFRINRGGEEFKRLRSRLRHGYPGWNDEDVMATSMNNYRCFPFKYVLHAVLRPFDDMCIDGWMKDLFSLYQNVFDKADALRLGSIALPFLGTGGKADTVVAIKTAVQSTAECRPRHLKSIKFVSLENGPIVLAKEWCQSKLKECDESQEQPVAGQMSADEAQKLDNEDKKLYFPRDKGDNVSKLKEDERKKTTAKNVEAGLSLLSVSVSTDENKLENASTKTSAEREDDETCPICMESMTDIKELEKCGHKFCRDCINGSFKHCKPICPSCLTVYGVITGNMPFGTIEVKRERFPSLPGYPGCGVIVIHYSFPDGIQTDEHPHPGRRYRGTSRTSYLPDNKEGQLILKLLRLAFDRRLTFTVGRSVTTGREDVVIWNDIHHKTSMHGGATMHGYPDQMYLSRVKEELASKGVTEDQLD